jgi:UDP-N-acetylglucosamine--N-acetylmuramyl-(pentapeptide) pyrophosphoryl-undecaprenol N-acetylglucosamine transferase
MGSEELYVPGKTLLLTGGGTGGHVVPALELARAHRKLSSGNLLYVGSPGSLEESLSRKENIPFEAVSSGGFVGKSPREKIKALLKILGGIGTASGILKKVRPGLLIGTGGYVQIPVVAAALMRGVPVVLLEPNQVMGLANRIFRPWVARVVGAGGSGMSGGIPVAPGVCGPPPLKDRFMGETLKIMVLGGSQGARSINEKVPEILRKALASRPDKSVEILHQSGERWKESTIDRYRELGLSARVEGFLPGLAARFREQTLIVARAGAMTVAEITASGTPAIYIPFPYSAGAHQEGNARAAEKKGAGWFWSEKSLDNVSVRADELSGILFDPERLFTAGKAAWAMSPAVSAEHWLLALGRSGNE